MGFRLVKVPSTHEVDTSLASYCDVEGSGRLLGIAALQIFWKSLCKSGEASHYFGIHYWALVSIIGLSNVRQYVIKSLRSSGFKFFSIFKKHVQSSFQTWGSSLNRKFAAKILR